MYGTQEPGICIDVKNFIELNSWPLRLVQNLIRLNSQKCASSHFISLNFLYILFSKYNLLFTEVFPQQPIRSRLLNEAQLTLWRYHSKPVAAKKNSRYFYHKFCSLYFSNFSMGPLNFIPRWNLKLMWSL